MTEPVGMKFVRLNRDAVVIVDRVDTEPPYMVFGRTRCIRCRLWCWLGSETYEMVNAGKAAPLCLPCANDHAAQLRGKLAGHLDDRPK